MKGFVVRRGEDDSRNQVDRSLDIEQPNEKGATRTFEMIATIAASAKIAAASRVRKAGGRGTARELARLGIVVRDDKNASTGRG